MERKQSQFISYFAVIGPGNQEIIVPKNGAAWEEVTYKPVIEHRFPVIDAENAPLPEHLPLFCLPDRIAPSETETAPKFFCITLTELTGERFYGAVLTFSEKVVPKTEATPPEALDRALTVSAISLTELDADGGSVDEEGGDLSEAEASGREHQQRSKADVSNDEGESDEGSDRERSSKVEEAEAPEASAGQEQLPSGGESSLSIGQRSRGNTAVKERSTVAPVFVQRCICILSRYPYFSTFRECLRELYMIAHLPASMPGLPVERYIAYILDEVPLPTPGGSVTFQLLHRRITCTRPPRHAFPSMDFCGRTLFRSLGVPQVLKLFASVLAEQKIIFTSQYFTMLTIAAETITQLLLPFRWHHIFIPILPRELLGFVEAPTPYIIGVDRKYKAEISNISGTTLVDLDTGSIETSEVFDLPPELQAIMDTRLQEILSPELVDMDAAFGQPVPMPVARGSKASSCAMELSESDRLENTRIRLVFIRFFASLFKDYRTYITFLRSYPEPITIFNKALFLKDHPRAAEDIGLFLDSQAFSMFLHHHHQVPDTVFDEVIQADEQSMPEVELWKRLTHAACEFASINVDCPSDCGWDAKRTQREGTNMETTSEREDIAAKDEEKQRRVELWQSLQADRCAAASTHGFPELKLRLFPRKLNESSVRINKLLREKSRVLDITLIKKVISESCVAEEEADVGDEERKKEEEKLERRLRRKEKDEEEEEEKEDSEGHAEVTRKSSVSFSPVTRSAQSLPPSALRSSETKTTATTTSSASSTATATSGTAKHEAAAAKVPSPPSHEDMLIQRSLGLLLEREEVPSVVLLKLDEKLANEKGRLSFANHLKQFGGKGAIHDLKPSSYDALVEVTRTALHLSFVFKEFQAPTIILEASGSFRMVDAKSGAEEMLHEKLRDMDIWKDRNFWEAAFFLAVASERKKLPNSFKVGSSKCIAWEKMDEERKAEVKTKEANLLFGLLGNFAFHMLNTDISAEHASAFLQQMSRLCALEPEQTAELLTLWNNMKQINEIITIDEELSKREAESKKSGKLFNFENYTTASGSTRSGGMELSALAFYRNLIKEGSKKASSSPSHAPGIGSHRTSSYSMTTLRGHSAGVSSLVLRLPLLVSASVQGEVRFWDLSANVSVFEHRSHADSVSGLAFVNDTLISVSADKSMVMVDCKTMTIVRSVKEHSGPITCLSSSGDSFITASEDKTVRVYDGMGTCETTLKHGSAVTAARLEVTRDAELVYAGCKDGSISVWDVASQQRLRKIEAHTSAVGDLCVLNNGLLLSLGEERVSAWELSSGVAAYVLEGNFTAVDCSEKVVVTGSKECKVTVWDAATGKELYGLEHENGEGEINSLAVNEVTKEVIAGGFDCTARVWNYRTGQLGAVLASHTDWIYAISAHAVNPLNTSEDTQLSGITGNASNSGGGVSASASSGDSAYVQMEVVIVTGSWDKTVKVWKRKVLVKKKKLRKEKQKRNSNPTVPKKAKRNILDSSRLSKMIKKTFV